MYFPQMLKFIYMFIIVFIILIEVIIYVSGWQDLNFYSSQHNKKAIIRISSNNDF